MMKADRQRTKDERDLASAERSIAAAKRDVASLSPADQERYAEMFALLEGQIAKLRANLGTEH
jgi:hypothetical protein